MKTWIKLFTYGLVAFTLLFASCEKDSIEGPVGPQGPAGTDGVNGQDGNANVMASEWIFLDFIQDDFGRTMFEVTDANLTEEVVNNSLILAYGKTELGNIHQLPFINAMFNYSFELRNNDTSYVLRFSGSRTGSISIPTFFTEIKYFVVPANGNVGKSARNDFKKMTYEEVMDYFGLEYYNRIQFKK